DIMCVDVMGPRLTKDRSILHKAGSRKKLLKIRDRAALGGRNGAAPDQLGSDGDRIGGHGASMRGKRIRSMLVRADRAPPKAELDQERQAKHGERNCDHDGQQAGLLSRAGQSQHRQQVEQSPAAEEDYKQPEWQIAIVSTFGGDGKLRICESEVDDSAKAIALERFRNDVAENLGDGNDRHCDPEWLATDPAFEVVQ